MVCNCEMHNTLNYSHTKCLWMDFTNRSHFVYLLNASWIIKESVEIYISLYQYRRLDRSTVII